jgi:hypothetical protein
MVFFISNPAHQMLDYRLKIWTHNLPLPNLFQFFLKEKFALLRNEADKDDWRDITEIKFTRYSVTAEKDIFLVYADRYPAKLVIDGNDAKLLAKLFSL